MAIRLVPKEELLAAAGTRFPPSRWLDMDQHRINTFADCTDDHQFIHVDPEQAAATPFGGTIAHGLLTLSLLPTLVHENRMIPDNTVMGLNYGFNKVRFLTPVPSGKRIRAHVELTSVEQKTDTRMLLTHTISIEIEGVEKPAMIAEWLDMLVTE